MLVVLLLPTGGVGEVDGVVVFGVAVVVVGVGVVADCCRRWWW